MRLRKVLQVLSKTPLLVRFRKRLRKLKQPVHEHQLHPLMHQHFVMLLSRKERLSSKRRKRLPHHLREHDCTICNIESQFNHETWDCNLRTKNMQSSRYNNKHRSTYPCTTIQSFPRRPVSLLAYCTTTLEYPSQPWHTSSPNLTSHHDPYKHPIYISNPLHFSPYLPLPFISASIKFTRYPPTQQNISIPPHHLTLTSIISININPNTRTNQPNFRKNRRVN